MPALNIAVALLMLATVAAHAAESLALPAQSATGPAAGAWAAKIEGLPLADREREIVTQLIAGNVPPSLRALQPVPLRQRIGGREVSATIFVAPDYLAVGTDGASLLVPLSPLAAQRVADATGCLLPTRKIVDAIYGAAAVKLPPSPLPPGPEMTSVTWFRRHDEIIRAQLATTLAARPDGTLIAGHKKDVVLSPRLAAAFGNVAIYGWHRGEGDPIQPLYTGHAQDWVDYSHGIRLVSRKMIVDGIERDLEAVLEDPQWCALVSDEGPVAFPRYRDDPFAGFVTAPRFGEQFLTLTTEHKVRLHIVAPAKDKLVAGRPIQLVFYALPNGNTIAQTLGQRPLPGDDWHFDIQHIAAQTRFVRAHSPDRTVILICLEAGGLSWPAWRKQHGDARLPEVIQAVRRRFAAWPHRITLSGHSGGGSFIFGWLNTLERIPDEVERLAFLDATYAFDPERHGRKLAAWLAAPDHSLCVLAYRDDIVRLDGKPVVSATGGSWFRSRLMRDHLAGEISFARAVDGELENDTGLEGRVQFRLHTNPAAKILHTVMVEKNGFIHCLLTGTSREEKDYRYFGARAYEEWIGDE